MLEEIASMFAHLLFWIAVIVKVGFPLLIPAFMWLYFSEEKKRSKVVKSQENPLN